MRPNKYINQRPQNREENQENNDQLNTIGSFDQQIIQQTEILEVNSQAEKQIEEKLECKEKSVNTVDNTQKNDNQEQNQQVIPIYEMNQVTLTIKQYNKESLQINTHLDQLLLQTPLKNNISDEAFKKKVEDLQDQIFKLRGLSEKIQNLQLEMDNNSMKYQRTQNQISQRIVDHLRTSPTLDTNVLGNLYQDLTEIQKKFEYCPELEKIQSILQDNQFTIKVVTIKNEIKQMKLKNSDDQQKQIEKLLDDIQIEISSRNMEFLLFQDKLQKQFDNNNARIQALQVERDFQDEQISSLQQKKVAMEKDIQELKKSMENDDIDYEEEVKNSIKKLQDDKDDIQSKIKQLKLEQIERNGKIVKAEFLRAEKLDSMLKIGNHKINLSNQYSNFHYLFVIDESSSFQGESHTQAIEGVLSWIKKLKQEDTISIIKFNSSARVIVQDQKISKITNQRDLRISIKQFKGGSTSFNSAFQLLQQVLMRSNKNEYPIILFLTDGQDTSDVSQTVKSIIDTANDLLFISIGYDQINISQLHSITKLFNQTSDLRREFNGKDIQLFYHNNEPKQLFEDICSIAEQTTTLSIQDINNAKTFYQESKQKQQAIIDQYYQMREDILKQSIQNLNQEIYTLQKIKGEVKFKKFQDTQIQQLNEQVESFTDQIQRFKEQKSVCLTSINELKNKWESDFEFLIGKKTGKIQDSDMIEFLKNKKIISKDPEVIYSERREIIAEFFNQKIKILEEKKSKLAKQSSEVVADDKQFLSKFGFIDSKHYQNFLKEIEDTSYIISNFNILQSSYQSLCDQFVSHIKLLEQMIRFSNKQLEEANFKFKFQNILDHFKEYVQAIDSKNPTGAIDKIIKYQNPFIEKFIQDNQLQKFYQNIIL
ncbi:hypothetical protein ABPG72_012690 [Tetrahymena utriculariae]